jgi:hypothetical protein
MSKASSSKRTAEDISKQAKKVKGVDVSAVGLAPRPALAVAASALSLALQRRRHPMLVLQFSCAAAAPQEVLKLVRRLAEQSRKDTSTEK